MNRLWVDGALFFELQHENVVINDYNNELINVYKVLTDEKETKKLIKLLLEHEKNNNKEYYYKIRNLDRDLNTYNKLNNIEKAARMIYLNKTSFNGMYRVNSNNQFNVPYNNNTTVKTFDIENLKSINKYLSENNIKILNGDFEEAIKDAKKGDFVYFDPPYDTLKEDTFTSYTDRGFDRNEQKRLFNVFKTLDKKGVLVMLSNHNTPFINELYKEYNIRIVEAKRSINADGKKRGKVEEVIITNY